MKKLVVLLLLISVTAAFGQDDKALVKATLEDYISADASRLERAFEKSATIQFTDAKTGEFRIIPIATYIENNRKNPPPPGGRKSEILMIDVEGTCAQGKIKFESPQAVIIDYMNLVKINGEWKIVSKIFTRLSK